MKNLIFTFFSTIGNGGTMKPLKLPASTLFKGGLAFSALLLILTACSSLGIGGIQYNPPKLEDAPKDLQDAVTLGRNIMDHTMQTLPDNVGNDLNCSNCHFEGGLTQGGKNGGISLVGVAATYPKYRSRQKYAVNMVTRVND
jgi:hypothetical protein